MFDDADKFLKIAVGLGVLAAGAGVGYHYGFRDQKSDRIYQDKVKKTTTAEPEEATPVSEPITHKFLDDGKIWLPEGMRCGSMASYSTDRFLKFNSTEYGKPYFWGRAFFGPYTISGSELAGYKLIVSVPSDYNPNIGMEGLFTLTWDSGAESVTSKIRRIGGNLSFGDKLYHSCGNNDLVE